MIEQPDEEKPRDAFSDPRLIPASKLAMWERMYWSTRRGQRVRECLIIHDEVDGDRLRHLEYLDNLADAEGDH